MNASPLIPTFPHLPARGGEASSPIPHPTSYRGGGWGGDAFYAPGGKAGFPTFSPPDEEIMTIEPQDATTVSIRAFPPNPPEVRTLQDYQADLIRRFGRVPSWPALAKRENAARTRLNGQSSMARPQKIVDNSPRTLAARAAIVAKGEETRKSIMRVLVKPMTSADVAHVLGRTPQLIHRHLVVLAERGAVVGGKVKRVMIWERRREAAE